MNDERQSPEGSRPAPQYGEYAPEGWEWNPPSDDAAPQGEAPAAGRITGVPHNLGTGSAAPSKVATQDPPPYRAGDPARHPRPAAPQQAGTQGRSGDRIFTIVLLVLGAIGALYLALTLFAMPQSLLLTSAALGLENFELPGWISAFATVSALAMFALYAVTLIWSIQRMRAGKMAFWVPLAAGVLSVLLTFILVIVVVAGMPELVQAFSDPTATERVLEYANNVEP